MRNVVDEGMEVIHVVSIGGWNAPHPDVSLSGLDWWKIWQEWNEHTVARPAVGWHGFSGFDWDVEGNDDVDSPFNVFSLAELDLMGTMSVAAKRAGYLVAMAPAQSYLDSATSDFSLSVSYAPSWKGDFPYHGKKYCGRCIVLLLLWGMLCFH
eukprot:m.383972 g.383972  ORF g.383972 m.383972 type:complete len:153 (+) comp20985_c0_seq23:1308-1766(+)